MRRLRQHFVAGLIVLLPFLVSLYIIESVIAWAASATSFIALWLFGHRVAWPGLWGLLIALALITVVGILANQYFGRAVLAKLEEVLRRVPVWRGLYDSVKQVLGTLVDRSGRAFQRVVYVPGPAPGSRILGFVVNEADAEGRVTVFVPLSPPTGGMVVLYPQADVESAGIPVEEAFRILLSAGTLGGRNRTAARDEPIQPERLWNQAGR
jgi:uncharacterized membrane protein